MQPRKTAYSTCRSALALAAALLIAAPALNAQIRLGGQEQDSRPRSGPPRRTLADLGNPDGFMQPVMSIHDRSREVSLGDGLLIVDLMPGKEDGGKVEPGSFVAFEFSVFKPDGTFIYSSKQPGHRPAGARISDESHPGLMFPAWEKAMLGINKNGVRKIFIPAELGPGENGFGPLPGGEPLVIEVGVFAVAPKLDPATANKGNGFLFHDVVEGEGDTFVEQGWAVCHLTVFDHNAELMGSTRLTKQAIGTPGIADRYWVRFALGMKPGASRAIEFDEPAAYRELRGAPENAKTERWRMVIDAVSIYAPITQTPHDTADEKTINEQGVKIVELEVGDGAIFPDTGFTAVIDYSVWYADSGELYDSTRKPGMTKVSYSSGLHPSPIRLALKGMRVGGKRLLITPPNFRMADDFSSLPVDEELVYEIELHDFEEAVFLLDSPGETIFQDVKVDKTGARDLGPPKP